MIRILLAALLAVALRALWGGLKRNTSRSGNAGGGTTAGPQSPPPGDGLRDAEFVDVEYTEHKR